MCLQRRAELVLAWRSRCPQKLAHARELRFETGNGAFEVRRALTFLRDDVGRRVLHEVLVRQLRLRLAQVVLRLRDALVEPFDLRRRRR